MIFYKLAPLLYIFFFLKIAVCKQKLHILGIYPKTGSGWTEPFVIYSAELAKRHIEQSGAILKDYELEIDWRDTQCSGGVATKNLIDALAASNNKTYLAVFGGGCAVATSRVAAISYRYGLAQIAYASTAPNLGNRKLYPKFVRGVPSDINAVPARAKFIIEQNWKRVAIINEQHPIFVASSHNMEVVLDDLNIDYRVEDFAPDGLIPLEQQVRTIASNLKTYRVIIANMYEDSAIELFCLLHKQNEIRLLHPYTTWIFLGWFTDQWNNKPEELEKVGCTAEEVAKISNGALGFLVAHNKTNVIGEVNSGVTISNYTVNELYQMYKNLTLENIGSDQEFNRTSDVHDAYVYDSLWTLALALHQAEENGFNLSAISQKDPLTDTEYFSDNSSYSQEIYNGMLAQEFQGWTGKVRYCGNEGHERVYELVQILEFVDGSLEYRGEITNVPRFTSNYSDVDSMGYVLNESYPFKFWKEEKASDGIETHDLPIAILAIFYVISFIMVVYTSFYVVFIVIGRIRNLESIHNSAPTLTSIIICGNYFLILANVFFISNDRIIRGTGQGFVSNVTGEQSTTEVCENDSCKFLCMFPIFLLLVASSIIFGAMMSKAALIHIVVVKLQLNPNKRLNYTLAISWPFLLATIDTFFVLLWSLVGPLVMKLEVIPSGIQDPPFFSVIQCGVSTEKTTETNVFIAILIVYKSVIVLCGLIMAYNLRSVQKQILRYGDTISWTMYNMTIFTLILILSFFLIQSYDMKIAIVSLLILATGFLTVTIIGFPPVYYSFLALKHKSVLNPVSNKPEIVQDKKMLEKSIASLQKDNVDLKTMNVKMGQKLSESGVDFPPAYEKFRMASVSEDEAKS